MPDVEISQGYFHHDGFGPDLKRLLEYKNLTPTELADKMGIHNSTIYYWISGRSLPNLDRLFKLARALNVTPEFLLSLVQESDWYKD